MTSVRRTVLVWTTAVLTAVGLLAFVIAYETARDEAATFLDGQLHQIALNVGLERPGLAPPQGVQDPEDEFVIDVWSPEGLLLTPSAGKPDLPLLASSSLGTVSAGGEDWRVIRVERHGRIVQVGQRMEVRAEIAETAALQAGLPVLLAIPLAWLVMGWGLRRVFARLMRVERAIAARSTDSADPIPLADLPEEMMPLVGAMNDLLGRIHAAMERQRRFVADAAHQLRTPLAALQIQIGNLAPSEGKEQTLAEMEGGVRRASRLVDQLLRMARLEEEHLPSRQSVDLTALVTQCMADFIPVAEAKGVDLGLVAADSVVMTGNAAELAMLFGNLIENAVRYTPVGGKIDVSIHRLGSAAEVEVTDTGPGIPEDSLPHVFERFFRATPHDTDGSGLGLSIAAAVARRHGMLVHLANRPEGGLRVRVGIERLILS